MNIARLGQSPSRILAAVLHWFDPELNNFKDFLSWRDRIPGNSDRFKKYLIRFANNVQLLNMDAVEAALLNTLIIVASGKIFLLTGNVYWLTCFMDVITTFINYKLIVMSDHLRHLYE